MVLIVSVSILALYAFATLVILHRRGTENGDGRYRGASFILVTYLLGALLFVFVMMTPQNMMSITAVAPISSGRHLVHFLVFQFAASTFLPSSRMWLPWASATTISFVFVSFVAWCLWNVIRDRDLGELESVAHEVSIRSPLLGNRRSSLLQGNKTKKRARKLAFLWIVPALFSAGVLITLPSLRIEQGQGTPVSSVNQGLIAFGALSSLTGFAVFFFRHYIILLLWLQTIWSLYSSVAISVVVAYTMIIELAALGSSPMKVTNIFIDLLGVATALLFLVGSVLTALFIRWVGPQLTTEINNSVQKRMEDIYDNE